MDSIQYKLAERMTIDQIIADYKQLTLEDVDAESAYATKNTVQYEIEFAGE